MPHFIKLGLVGLAYECIKIINLCRHNTHVCYTYEYVCLEWIDGFNNTLQILK